MLTTFSEFYDHEESDVDRPCKMEMGDINLLRGIHLQNCHEVTMSHSLRNELWVKIDREYDGVWDKLYHSDYESEIY